MLAYMNDAARTDPLNTYPAPWGPCVEVGVGAAR